MDIIILTGGFLCFVASFILVIRQQARRIRELEKELMDTVREFAMYQSAVRGDDNTARVLSAGAKTRITYKPAPVEETEESPEEYIIEQRG